MSDKMYTDTLKTGSSISILAGLYRTILMDLGITPTRFDRLMENYRSNALVPGNVKKIYSQRGNLKKELVKPGFSWNVFIRGLVLLNVKKFEITLRIHHTSGAMTDHHKSVILSNFEDEDD